LDAIREDIDELDGLIACILELSKLDSRESPLKPEPLDPSELIKELVEKFRTVTDRKGLLITTELSYEPPFVGDRETLRSALRNVLDNAAKFTPEKGEVSVRMGWQPDSLEIGVTNTFEEIPEDDLVRIFDPFHRTRRSPAAGSGLGLAITKKAVGRHGGSIEARNTGKGLEIRMSLPRRP
jgi:signal transduction histidine kinase